MKINIIMTALTVSVVKITKRKLFFCQIVVQIFLSGHVRLLNIVFVPRKSHIASLLIHSAIHKFQD
jgi:hypothetical protein